MPPRERRPKPGAAGASYGVVVLSVNVSVLLYVPVRSGSLAAIDCLNVTGTASLEVGAVQVLMRARGPRGSGERRERERAVDQLAGVGRARVGDAERRVTGRRDDGGRGGGRCTSLRDARRERAELRRGAHRQGQRRRRRCRRRVPGVSVCPSTWRLDRGRVALEVVGDPLQRLSRGEVQRQRQRAGRGGFHSVEAVVGVEPSVV